MGHTDKTIKHYQKISNYTYLHLEHKTHDELFSQYESLTCTQNNIKKTKILIFQSNKLMSTVHYTLLTYCIYKGHRKDSYFRMLSIYKKPYNK